MTGNEIELGMIFDSIDENTQYKVVGKGEHNKWWIEKVESGDPPRLVCFDHQWDNEKVFRFRRFKPMNHLAKHMNSSCGCNITRSYLATDADKNKIIIEIQTNIQDPDKLNLALSKCLSAAGRAEFEVEAMDINDVRKEIHTIVENAQSISADRFR